MRRPPPRSRQRGVAVVTALLLTTLAISIVASLFWQQQVQVRSMENQRLHLQTKWILRGALDWASLVLRQDNYTSSYTSLDQVWATPLAETRLDQYIERERVEGENFDASLSGNIIDATSRYNLSNLAKDRLRVPAQETIFRNLLTQLRLDTRLAQRVAVFVAQGQAAAPVVDPQAQAGGAAPTLTPVTPEQRVPAATGVPIPVMQVDDLLAVQGMTPQILAQLRPFLIVLPPETTTTLNVNTVPAELLAAMSGMPMSEATRLVARRKTAAWRTPPEFAADLPANTQIPDGIYAVKSGWFVVQSRIRLDRAALNAEALIARRDGAIGAGGTEVIWTRQN